jgi:hypothetical protein
MFNIKNRLTNVRPSKTETPEVSTTPTPGNFKINSPGALALGLKSGDYLDVVDAEVNGEVKLYIGKGIAPEKVEDGTDEKGKAKFKTVKAGIGSKLASANGKISGTLQASSANTYFTLKGNKESNMIYSIDLENPQVDAESGTTYYALTFSRQEEKQVKEAK